MSEEEFPVAIGAGAVAVVYWAAWLRDAGHTSLLVRPAGRLTGLILCLLGGLGIVFATLLTWADPVVRASPSYILLFLAVAGVALAVATAVAAVLGVSPLDDAVRRPNPAAAFTTAGVWLGTSLTVAGANVGRGDTIGTTIGPLALGVVALLALWAVLAVATGAIGSVTHDRDVPAGVRQAGLLIAWGLILGRATAGDWESVAGTWEDFANQGWPALVLLAIAIPLEWWLRPRADRPAPRWPARIGPALAYVLAATSWLAWL
ncbi:MAG: hypothetical protein J2P46_20920, partial [Zavarzinella sp.]|nr:hypothetical protein [Zavarzinella sp.]